MSVYVGIDVHRRRSQVAVVTEDGTVQLNKNEVNGSEPMLRLIGDLPSGTPVASGAAFGWSWLTGLLEDYGFGAHLVHPLRCKAIASARLKNELLTELPDASAAQACPSQRPIAEMPGRSGLPGCCSLAASPITTETGHTGLNQLPAFSLVPVFDVSRSRPSAA